MATRRALKTAKRQTRNPLDRYRSIRDFQATSEPRGSETLAVASTPDLPFVVQKHAATRLHYDFRLGWGGVLRSWAVAKGPSYFPGDKRLAVQVEDHPMEYGDFEGTIPKGQYGGGTVMVWDTGTWTPLGHVDRGLREGHLKFELYGKKLRGSWALIRMHSRGKDGARPEKPNWLLIKERDEEAGGSSDRPITEEAPDSAVSGRTMDEIAGNASRVWNPAQSYKKSERNGTGTERPSEKAAPAGKSRKAGLTTTSQPKRRPKSAAQKQER